MTKKNLLVASLLFLSVFTKAQTNPAITSWIQNTTGITGRHYISGSSTPIVDATYPANVQSVAYNTTHVYVSCSGIPAYVIGPYLDGNPNQGGNNNNKYKIPLNPVQNTGTPTNTTGGTIGVFINGVSLFDYRDGVSWKNSTGAEAGGPSGGMGDGVWNRDAIPAEKAGFDCAKGHPAMTNYHHHQNPSAFNLDLTVISTVCNLYLADGLYVIDSTMHSPLIGFAYDGFPIYGAYSYKNANGTGGIVRMKSSYSLRSISTRTTYADGTTVTPGPPVSTTYPLGRYREDYQYNVTSAATPDYLDEHNGRFCITPEYPLGTYAYFCTVDANWNSYYPYVVGPTFYGTKVVTTVTTIPSGLTTYVSTTGISTANDENLKVSIYPNPANDVLFIQSHLGGQTNRKVELVDELGKVIQTQTLFQGSTMCYFDLQTVYAGIYFVRITDGTTVQTSKVIVSK
jgi:YHYH protein/Secretion system C-terminal sorting domain